MRDKVLSVSQLNGYIKGVFEDELVLHNIAVFGEVFERSVSGSTTFLTLKEGDCVLHCVRYAASAPPDIGEKVLLTGSVAFYPKGGRVSFVYRDWKPYGQSVLYAAFLRLKERLTAEGVFANKPPLPPVIRRVAVVTSAAGAVIHDIATVLENRGAFAGVTVFPVRVQGEEAAAEIAAAVRTINDRFPCDVIVIARGGGANTDLAPFNTEIVARAVGASRLPVVSAVGHETDTTLCDFAATVRVATPSVAAALVAESNERTRERLLNAAANADRAAARLLKRRTAALHACGNRLTAAAERRIQSVGRKLAGWTAGAAEGAFRPLNGRYRALGRLTAAASAGTAARLGRAETGLKVLAARAESVNPLKVLAAGYVKVTKDGAEVGSVEGLKAGDDVKLLMKDGAARAAITEAKKYEI